MRIARTVNRARGRETMQTYDFDLRGGFSHVEEAVQSEAQTVVCTQKPAQAPCELTRAPIGSISHYSLHLPLSLPVMSSLFAVGRYPA